MKTTHMILGNRVLALVLAMAMLLPMAMPAMAAESIPTQTQTVTKGETTVSRTALWDFAAASQLADFSLYQSATSKLVHSDGKLIADGADGEMKALITNSLSNVRSVSVDIIPGTSGLVNAGLYVGAKSADSGMNAIEAMTFMVQSNFSGWSDAPNRIDIIQGQFNNNWAELSRTISEAGNGNALFSGGNKQPLNLKLTFGDDLLLLTLSLVSNPNKYLQLMYQVDSAALEGQLGLRANACDVHFDNLQVEYEQELPENSLLWDFADASQAEDFTFYTNGNNSFVVTDGMLKSNGGNGEMKAIFNEDMANIAAMSVDIIPGASGLMNAGVYVGAKNVSADQDKADAISVMIESMFSGWDDAPNRIDLWLGKFTQGWGGEVAGSRLVSETGNKNALYAGGVKKALNLKLEFGGNTMTATLSLVENPNRFVQKTWTMEEGQLQGQIGLRNQFIDLCYDNLIITYKTPTEQPAPEEETVYVNAGYSFCQSSLRPWKLTKELTATPYTLEAWVNAPQGVHDNAVGYIVGNASRAPAVSMQMIAGGKLRLSYKTENADLTVSTKNFDVDTDIRTGKWTHVAYTVDVASDTVIAYINGEAAATWNEAGLTAITIPDKIVPGNTFAIGSLESSDDATNKFVGLIADVRLWNSPLSAAQIAESMMTQYTEPVEGLLFNAPLAELAEGVFADLSGNGNTVAPYDSMLNLQTETHEPGAYSMVVIPDQQILNNYAPDKLMAMYQWIADNREKENIQIVMNVGDMADNCGNLTQWENNKAAVALLPADLPFIAAPGNHDYDTNSGWDKGYGVREQLTLMNQYLPRSLFEAYPTEIGFFDEVNSANQWQSFAVNGNNYLVIALEYVPQDDVIAWANDVVSSHPNHQVIVVTHSYVGSYGNLDQPHLWNAFISQHENIIMAFSGHVWHTNVVRRTDKGINGNDVHQMLMDAQVSDTGSEGNKNAAMIGLLRFNADGTQCDVSYYSTSNNMYDAGSNFTLNLPKQEQTFVATAGGKSYTSVSQALESGEPVQLLDNCNEKITVTKDAVIDLAGFDMTDVTVAEGMQLTLIDTVTDDYTGEYGCATVSGTVMPFAQADGKNYMIACEDGVYSAHAYDVEVTHVSLKPAQDALGYKAKLLGDEMVLKYATAVGFNMWVDNNPAKTCTTAAKQEFTLRLKNILAANGGLMEIHATAFVSFDGRTLLSQQHTTTMQQTLRTIDGAWNLYDANQKAAVKDLCDQYYDTVCQWGLDNIYPIADDGTVNSNYEAITGSVTVNNISGFAANGKLTAPNNGEGKVILENTPAGNKTISVELYPNGSINSGIYLGASNATAPQDSVNAIAVIIESSFSNNPNRADIVIGNFPAWEQYHRYVIEGTNALFTDGVKEPVKLTVQQSGNDLTVTLALISDPSKSATTTYTYTGSYDLANGQVGLRSQYNNCAFDNFQVNDVTYTFDNEASTDGLFFYHSACANGVQATATNSLILHSSATFTGGTYAATMNTAGKNAAGIVFGADDSGKNYHLFRIGANQFVELVKVENGVETILDRGYLSAGHINTNDNRLEIVKDGDTVYCYYYNRFDKINCYAVNAVSLAGDRVGLWAAASGTIFRDVTITNVTENRTAETLIFGHSYTEMWLDYETYFPEYTDIDDIGIGGSVAAHWESLTDEIISYEPTLGIYNIGINDLTGGTPPKAIIESMEKALLEIKAALPEFEVVLVSVSHCPARPAITDTISQTNALMRNLAASYDWMYYAEAEYLFCTDPTDPLSTNADLFIDGLHPSAEGYQMMAEVVKAAIRGENQPDFDEELAAAQLAEVKANKLASMDIYSEAAYTAENWASAKPYYEAAIAKIEACTTEAELKALDLSAELAALEAIPGKSVELINHLLDASTRSALNADSWTKTDARTVNVSGYSYALDKTALYGDSELVFKASNNTGTIATGGIFLRAKSLANKGIQGYLINYVTGGEYLQVYYVDNVYNTDGSPYTLTYIGGINYGAYGKLVDTDFYAKIEGDTLYVNTLERHMAGQTPLVQVDLTYGGQYEVFADGYTGVLSWNNGVSFDMSLQHFAGAQVKDDTLKVLAIGNSFSIDGMEYVHQIAQDLGVEKIKLGNLYIGGCSLATHYSNLQSNNAAYTYYVNTDGNWVANKNCSLQAALESENWDVITFQQASGYSGVADSYDTLPDLIAGVKELCPNAKFGWHMTWAYQGDSTHADFVKYNNDQSTMYNAIVSAVQNKILTNADIDFVIPAGTAIQNARTSYLGDRLTRDGYHLSYDVGRYIAGITWVEALTGLDASNLTYCPAGITEEVMALSIESSKNAAATPYAITNSAYSLEDRFIQLDLNLTSGWYDSTNTSGDPQKVYASTSSLPFYKTKIFTKAELPVGTIIVNDAGYNYRPEGWVDGTGVVRPAAVTTKYVMVTDDWWGDWTERAFNIKVASLNVTAEEAEAGFKIYVPKSAYMQLDLSLSTGYYNSVFKVETPQELYAWNSSLPYYATKIFSKAELPVGTVITYTGDYNYRPDGWVNGAGTTRPGNVESPCVMVDEAWWGDYTERGFNIKVADTNATAEEVAEVFKIYVPLSAYEEVKLSVIKAFYNSNLYSSTKTQAASTSLKFFSVQTFTEETLPLGSIILNTEGRNIRLERWIDGTVKNSDGSRGGMSTAKQLVVDASWWDGFDTRAFNIPVASLEDSEVDALLETFIIYVPKG